MSSFFRSNGVPICRSLLALPVSYTLLLTSCATTARLASTSADNRLTWNETSKHGKTCADVSGVLHIRITGPNSEPFDHLIGGSDVGSVEYDRNSGVATLTFEKGAQHDFTDSLELATFYPSADWQERYDKGEQVQASDTEKIGLLGIRNGGNVELKAMRYTKGVPAEFPDAYRIVVNYETKYDPERPARLAKERDEKAAAEQIRAQEEQRRIQVAEQEERRRIQAAEKIAAEAEKADLRRIRKEELEDLNKAASYVENKGCVFALASVQYPFKSYAVKGYLLSSRYLCVSNMTMGSGTINEKSGCSVVNLDGKTGRFTPLISNELPVSMLEGKACSKAVVNELLNLDHIGQFKLNQMNVCGKNILDASTCDITGGRGQYGYRFLPEPIVLLNEFNVTVPTRAVSLEEIRRN